MGYITEFGQIHFKLKSGIPGWKSSKKCKTGLIMAKISDIIKDTSHRPYQLPNGHWQYYQEWNEVLFLHWSIPVETIRKLIPKDLEIDTFKGKAYISLVPFSMKNTRPRYFPSIPLISDFHEINIRTYVSKNEVHGVLFLKIEAQKLISAIIARRLSGLPYKKSRIRRENGKYSSGNPEGGSRLHVEFKVGDVISAKSDLDKFLTERYCLFLEENNKIFRYDIHHKEWPLRSVKINMLEISYKGEEIDQMASMPEISHYSDGVKVLAWQRFSL